MPNVAKVLKEEILRLAKKEARTAVSAVKKDAVTLKKTAADLKRRVSRLERENRHLMAEQIKRRQALPPVAPEIARKARVTSKGVRSLRAKLRLSRAAFGKLLGVTSQSVYNWERKGGALRIRGRSRAALLAARNLGAREAKRRLRA